MSRLTTDRDFPFCQENHFVAAVIPESFFPIAVTKETFFKWIYRVKAWQFDMNLTVTSTLGITTTLVGMATVVQGISGTPYTDESDLSCSATTSDVTGIIIDGGTINVPSLPPESFNIVGSLELAILAPAAEYAGPPDDSFYLRLTDGDEADEEAAADNLFLPSLRIGVMASDTMTFVVQSGPNPAPEATLNVSFDGISIPIFSPGNPGDIVTGTLNITPVVWWEHDPGDGGGPVWDSTDGSELRNPFSC